MDGIEQPYLDDKINLRLTSSQRSAIEDAARAAKRRVSDWARLALEEAAAEELRRARG